MLTGNREYNEIYKKYKNLVLKVAYIYSGDNYDAAEDIETEFIEKEEVLYKKQFHEKIMAALSKKNPRWYEAIILVYYMDIPQVKVAEIMEIRKEVLHALLHRAKKWIRKKFGAEYEEMQDKDGRIP